MCLCVCVWPYTLFNFLSIFSILCWRLLRQPFSRFALVFPSLRFARLASLVVLSPSPSLSLTSFPLRGSKRSSRARSPLQISAFPSICRYLSARELAHSRPTASECLHEGILLRLRFALILNSAHKERKGGKKERDLFIIFDTRYTALEVRCDDIRYNRLRNDKKSERLVTQICFSTIAPGDCLFQRDFRNNLDTISSNARIK